MNLLTKFVLNKLVKKGRLIIIDANDRLYEFGVKKNSRAVTIKIKNNLFFLRLLITPGLALGEAYMNQTLIIKEGTISQLLEILFINNRESFYQKIQKLFLPLIRKLQCCNSIKKSQKNVAHHYDLSYDFYKLFLDGDLQYSCAYFENEDDSLETAQLKKKYHIASKLLLKPKMKILDIGCGFGGMAIYLAKNFDVEVVGLTLSKEQYKIANKRVKIEGLENKVKFYLRDYRQEKNSYDRIVSVGMFEHVGIACYKKFFQTVKNLLKDDGIMLLHSIGRADEPGVTDAWIKKYIFPGGYIPALSEALKAVESTWMWVSDIEILRLHYAKTLKNWRERLITNQDQVKKIYDEEFLRMWEFYLAASEMQFRYNATMVFQMQLTKDINAVPLTRDYMFSKSSSVFDLNQLESKTNNSYLFNFIN